MEGGGTDQELIAEAILGKEAKIVPCLCYC